MKVKTKGKTPIQNQAEKLFRHTRSGSYGTRARYQSSCNQFLQFVHDNFKMKNLRNLHNKHIVAFVEQRIKEGISIKTIKNDLGAIRYLHDMIPNAKHELARNDELEKEIQMELKTEQVSDRAWTDEEYESMYEYVDNESLHDDDARDVRDSFVLGRTMGLRVTEAIAMHRSQAEDALRNGIYRVGKEAKNGKPREVPLSRQAKEMLEERLKTVERGDKVFVKPIEKTHQAVNRIVKYIENNRDRFETREGRLRRTRSNGNNPLTFHGLRYNYVQERINQKMLKGKSFNQAATLVTKEVGHNRIDVISIYMGD